MNNIAKNENYVHVTLASLNKPNSFFKNDIDGSGLIISGWKVPMASAVFCGRVLGTKV